MPLLVATGSLSTLGLARLVAAHDAVTAGGGSSPPSSCPVVATGAARASLSARVWYQLRERTAGDGALLGYELRVGRLGLPEVVTEPLPPESFAAGPFDGTVLYGSDDGRVSVVHAIDGGEGCRRELFRSRDVVRSATLAPDRHHLFYHALDRATRADRGIWRAPLAGSDSPVQVLPGLIGRVDGPFGPTFSTSLRWSTDGSELTVQSCGALHCRTRLLDPARGNAETYDRVGIGELLGATKDELVAYAACTGLPCPVLSLERGTGRVGSLIGSAGTAVLITSDGRPSVVYETAGGDRSIRAVDLSDRSDRLISADPPATHRLHPGAARGMGSLELPADSWPLTTDDGLGSDGVAAPRALRLSDDTIVEITEVTR